MSTSLFLTVLYSPVCNAQSLSLYCALHAFLSFVQGLNTTLGDRDPPLDTDKRSHYTEGRQSQLHSALCLVLSSTHLYKHAHTCTQCKTQSVHIMYVKSDKGLLSCRACNRHWQRMFSSTKLQCIFICVT